MSPSLRRGLQLLPALCERRRRWRRMPTVHDHLVTMLEDLDDGELKKFKAKLNEIAVPEGSSNIPRGKLQRADVVDLSHLLVSYYTDADAVPVAARALESIGLRQQAGRLLDAAGIGDNGSNQTPVQSCSVSSRREAEPHFVEIHRAELIERTSTVEAVLDLLCGRILSQEQYERITSEKTDQAKMRQLYRLVARWDRSCKDRLYEALKAKNKLLIEELKGR